MPAAERHCIVVSRIRPSSSFELAAVQAAAIFCVALAPKVNDVYLPLQKHNLLIDYVVNWNAVLIL